jgi:hypothetical protein
VPHAAHRISQSPPILHTPPHPSAVTVCDTPTYTGVSQTDRRTAGPQQQRITVDHRAPCDDDGAGEHRCVAAAAAATTTTPWCLNDSSRVSGCCVWLVILQYAPQGAYTWLLCARSLAPRRLCMEEQTSREHTLPGGTIACQGLAHHPLGHFLRSHSNRNRSYQPQIKSIESVAVQRMQSIAAGRPERTRNAGLSSTGPRNLMSSLFAACPGRAISTALHAHIHADHNAAGSATSHRRRCRRPPTSGVAGEIAKFRGGGGHTKSVQS